MIQTSNTKRTSQRAAYSFAAIVVAIATGCAGPSYPNCTTDDTCRPSGEYCVDRKCAQCRVSAHCPGLACATCEHGTCGLIAGCCTTSYDCKRGQKCASGRCDIECHADKECPGGQRCDPNGACLASALINGGKSDGCTHDEDCGGDLRCVDGMCIDAANRCQIVPARFESDQYALSSEVEDVLVADFKCMKRSKQRTVAVQGHDDDRRPEFNMRRAAAIKAFFHKLDPKLKVEIVTVSVP